MFVCLGTCSSVDEFIFITASEFVFICGILAVISSSTLPGVFHFTNQLCSLKHFGLLICFEFTVWNL